MWQILGIIIVSLGIVALEVPPLLEKGFKKELWIFSVLLTVGLVLSILFTLGIKIPNPYDMLTTIYQPFTDFILSAIE